MERVLLAGIIRSRYAHDTMADGYVDTERGRHGNLRHVVFRCQSDLFRFVRPICWAGLEKSVEFTH